MRKQTKQVKKKSAPCKKAAFKMAVKPARRKSCRGDEAGRQVYARLEIEPGVEIHIARDATIPASREEGQALREKISVALRDEFQRRGQRQRGRRSD